MTTPLIIGLALLAAAVAVVLFAIRIHRLGLQIGVLRAIRAAHDKRMG